MGEKIILVDKSDKEISLEDKLEAHKTGKLHRACSVVIYNKQGEMLLQQRAKTKYHSGGKWTNACCTHPRPGESVDATAHRRLYEEMGFDCSLLEVFSFVYEADVGQGMIEHEFDHVFIGKYDRQIRPNPDEVENYAWWNIKDLQIDMANNPGNYTPWFKIIFKRVLEHTNK